MKHYIVNKCEPFVSLNGKTYTAIVGDYGLMSEEYMKLTTRGYKPTKKDGNKTTYTRKNSKYIFEVEEV
jgi:hypothetical protein